MDWGDLPAWVGVMAGVVAFGVGLKQYHTAQQWKRAEFVAAEAKTFFTDSDVATALLMIDYSRVRLDHKGQRSRTGFVFEDPLIVNALAVHQKFVDEVEVFDDHELQVRSAFDAFFTGLDRFDHYLQTDLIELDDLKIHFEYWIKRVGDPSFNWKEPSFYNAVHAFVDEYGYKGVRHLFTAFGVPKPS